MSSNYYEFIKQIDNVLAQQDISTSLFNETLQVIRSDKAIEEYFFRNAKDPIWFEFLNRNRYFSPSNIAYDNNGNALFWDVMGYLERLSEQGSKNYSYGAKLLDVIKNLVQFSKNEKRINNYHIWWYCVKIINNLPTSIITKNLSIEDVYESGHAKYGFRTWVETMTDSAAGSDLAVTDIGTKLLPKFLADDSAIRYAEVILNIMAEIGPGGRRSTLGNKEDAKLNWDSYWVLEAFKKNYELIGRKCSVDAVLGIADKLKRALEYKHKNGFNYFEVDDRVYRIDISRIQKEGGRKIEFEPDRYICNVGEFSPKQLEKADKEHLQLALYNTDPEIPAGKQFSFTASSKREFLAVMEKELPKDIQWEKTEEFEKRLGFIFDGLFEDYSQIWFKSLAAGGRDYTGDAEEVLTIILRDVLTAKCNADPSQGEQILEAFLSPKFPFPIFRRFILLCANRYWDNYCQLVEKLFGLGLNPLHKSDYEVELYDLLSKNHKKLTATLVIKLKEFIADVPEYYRKEGEEAVAAWKLKWLPTLKERDEFKDDYLKAKEKCKRKDGKDYEPERSAFEGGFITHKSPLSKEEILQRPMVDFVKYLKDFQGAEFWQGTFEGEPDKEGLADILQAAVKDDPKKFTDGMDNLLEVPYFYLNRVFRGLKEAWNTNKDIDWPKIFEFCLKYFDRDKEAILTEAFQAQKDDSGKGRYIWIIESVVELISDGSQNDTRAFDSKHFDDVERIFDLIIPLLKGEKRPETQRDVLTYALNTALGRTIMAYVTFSLRKGRMNKKEDNWGQNKYERFFNIGIDAYIWFGCDLPQMRYLDIQYADNKIAYFSGKSPDDFEWQMFMEGYLSGSRVYKDVYGLMKENYSKALGKKLSGEWAERKLVEHLCIGYLQIDDDKDNLFWKMLDEASTPEKRDRWLEVVGFFWGISGRTLKKEERENQEEPSEDIRNKILAFWAWTFKERESIKAKLAESYSSFLSRILELTIWLDRVDEDNEKWIKLSVPHLENQHRSFFFIEYLTKFDDEGSVKRIGKILIEVLKHETPRFKEDQIKLIVERLYKIGEKDAAVKADADDICNTYGRRGIHFLKETWTKNQDKALGGRATT